MILVLDPGYSMKLCEWEGLEDKKNKKKGRTFFLFLFLWPTFHCLTSFFLFYDFVFPWIDADALVTQFTSKFSFFYPFFFPSKEKKKRIKKGECNVYCKTNDNPNSYLCYWDNKGVMFFRQGVSSLGFASPSTTSSSHWTLFSKFFATFPRGTCVLSIFRRNI